MRPVTTSRSFRGARMSAFVHFQLWAKAGTPAGESLPHVGCQLRQLRSLEILTRKRATRRRLPLAIARVGCHPGTSARRGLSSARVTPDASRGAGVPAGRHGGRAMAPRWVRFGFVLGSFWVVRRVRNWDRPCFQRVVALVWIRFRSIFLEGWRCGARSSIRTMAKESGLKVLVRLKCGHRRGWGKLAWAKV